MILHGLGYGDRLFHLLSDLVSVCVSSVQDSQGARVKLFVKHDSVFFSTTALHNRIGLSFCGKIKLLTVSVQEYGTSYRLVICEKI